MGRRRIILEVDDEQAQKWSEWLRSSDTLSSYILATEPADAEERAATIQELAGVGIEVKADEQVDVTARVIMPVGRTKRIWPWHEMAVGESFFVEGDRNDKVAWRARSKNLGSHVAQMKGRYPPKVWKMRTEATGWRIWREA